MIFLPTSEILHADMLSRLVPDSKTNDVILAAVSLEPPLVSDLEGIPLEKIVAETHSDLELKQVIIYTGRGWPRDSSNPYAKLKVELSIRNDAIQFRYKLVIPKSCRLEILGILHTGHVCADTMKQTASTGLV